MLRYLKVLFAQEVVHYLFFFLLNVWDYYGAYTLRNVAEKSKKVVLVQCWKRTQIWGCIRKSRSLREVLLHGLPHIAVVSVDGASPSIHPRCERAAGHVQLPRPTGACPVPFGLWMTLRLIAEGLMTQSSCEKCMNKKFSERKFLKKIVVHTITCFSFISKGLRSRISIRLLLSWKTLNFLF